MFKLPYIVLLSVIVNTTISTAQDTMTWKLANPQLTKSKAVDSTLNILENTASLATLFEKLYLLKTQPIAQKIIFTHIGDSHIQADKITTIVRNEFQNYFGNAGRGLLFPFQVAKTNGPSDFYSTSNELWKSSRLSKMNQEVRCGIAAYGIKTDQTEAEIKMVLKDSLKNNFDQVSLFYAPGLKTISIESTSSKNDFAVDSTSKFTAIQLSDLRSRVSIKLDAIQNRSIGFFGVSLSKKATSGIIYNAIGANGAKINDYNEAPLFWEQLPELKTDCYIIALGTNEAQNQTLTSELYTFQLKTMVDKIKNISPNAAIIIITPPVSYFKKIKPNKSLPVITAAIKEFCYQNNVALWNFFDISKGTRGTVAWRKLRLLNTDLVHFTNAGYSLQGALFADAFAKAYNNYTMQKQH